MVNAAKLSVVLSIVVTLLVNSAFAQAASENELVTKAKTCTKEAERLKRLACFDRVFSTPIHADAKLYGPGNVPFSWHQAMDSFADTLPDEIAHLNLQGSGTNSNAWLTIGASNTEKPFKDGKRPVLMLSCIDKISRVELALPDELKSARVKVTLVSGDTRIWRSDDSGYMISAGRGLPAVNQMKQIMNEKSITLRASDKAINGLVFRTETLKEDLKPLRERCDW